MKIISWNCNMAFRKKYHKIMELRPDLLIVIECESEDKLKPAIDNLDYKEIIWVGENPHKGIAIIRFSDFEIKPLHPYHPEFRYILPYQIIAKKAINLFVIWAMPYKGSPTKGYVGQIWRALQFYKKDLENNTLLIGDFNSNAIWDHTRKKGNHTEVVQFLRAYQIDSLYHLQKKEQHGQETAPTQFMYRHRDKPYHLDYCFSSKALVAQDTVISIGGYEEWISLSDHMPIIVENLRIKER